MATCFVFRRFLLFSTLFFFSSGLWASTISGTVKDGTGAVVPKARVEIRGTNLEQPVIVISDAAGHFACPDLKPGSYVVRIVAEGFEPLERKVELSEIAQSIDFALAVAVVKQEVTVAGKSARFANTDSAYVALRNVGLGSAFQVQDFTFKCDAARFQLTQGTLVFLAPVNGVVTGAVYVGAGHLHVTPPHRIARAELMRRVKSEEFDEDFSEIVFRYAGGFTHVLLGAAKTEAAVPPQAAPILEHWRDLVRKRREEPLGFTESILHGDSMENVDAELLAALYNPERPGFFDAYIHGTKHKDLRFYYRPRGGAIPELSSPDEVALVNYDPEGMDDGIWYLEHTVEEYNKREASSEEERRYVTARKFKIETVIGNNDHLTSVATVTFSPIIPGERVVKFRLLPNLRVTRVSDTSGQDLYFIQESRKQDGSFYTILPQPPEVGKDYSVTVEYSGDKVLTKAGNGSYYVEARESWYPNLNGFNEHALYDLTYKVPKKYKVISVGNLDKEWKEGDFAASHWTTPSPVAVAGFNFGSYQKLELADETTGTHIEGYYLTDLPDNLAGAKEGALASMAPKSMAEYALQQTRAQLQLCTYYYGKSPFDHIYITEQPNFSFGQSWPNLVYLPISAYIDSTQRWMLFGRIDTKFQGFVDEVTPHEVAHQWWGHAVSWASYHDQWLSEGFAEFSAALFLQQARGKDWVKDYTQFWERQQKRIFEKNEFGVAPNDAGPIWLGLRLISPRSESGYQQVTYAKGAYILGMLRSMMYDPQDRDKTFVAMMQDFVKSYEDHPASTESFKATAEKHMTKEMDLQHNGRLDWFFNEWVYGTQAPKYSFSYDLKPETDHKTKVHVSLTQSEVDGNFAMLVPIYGDFGKGMIPLIRVPMVGSSTREFNIELPVEPKKIALNAYKEILTR